MKHIWMTLWFIGLIALLGFSNPSDLTLDFDDEDDLPEYVTVDFDDEDDLPEYVTLDFDDEDDLPEYVTLGICRDKLQALLDEVVARQARPRHPLL